MRSRIILIISLMTISCGPSVAYGDYVNSDGMTRKQIEAIRNHPNYKIPLGPNQSRGIATGFWFNIADLPVPLSILQNTVQQLLLLVVWTLEGAVPLWRLGLPRSSELTLI